MESSYGDNWVVLSGLPVVPQQEQRVLSRFVLRKLSEQNPNDHSKIYVPVNGTGHSIGLAIVRYPTADIAAASIRDNNGTSLDRNHVVAAETLHVSQALRAARVNGHIDDQQMGGITGLQVV